MKTTMIMRKTTNPTMANLVKRPFLIPSNLKPWDGNDENKFTIFFSANEKTDFRTVVRGIGILLTTKNSKYEFQLSGKDTMKLKGTTNPAAASLMNCEFIIPPMKWMEGRIALPTIDGRSITFSIEKTEIEFYTTHSVYGFELV